MVSGTLWNVGNVGSIYGIQDMGYAIAYPLMQTALFVGGLWGILAFKEIKGRAIAVFFTASGVLLVGALLLVLYG